MISNRAVRSVAARLMLVLVLVAAVGCSRSPAAAPPSATVGTEPPRTTTTDPYAVPAVIDEAYVNRILSVFDAINGEVSRLVVRTRTIPPEAIDRYRSIYGKGKALQLQVDLLQNDMLNSFADYKDPPGDQRTTVERLLTVTPTCLFVQVQRDYSAVTVQSNPSPSRLWVVLLPDPGDIDPWQYNPTPWYSPYDGYDRGRVAPPDPCRPQ